MARRNVTAKTHAPDGSLTISELDRREREWLDAQPTTARCAFCPWVFVGTAAAARESAAEHRAKEHPDAKPGRLSAAEAKEQRAREAAERAAIAARREQERARGALEAMDAGEPTRPLEPEPEPRSTRAGVGPGPKWTRETAIVAIRAYAAREGHPPSSTHGDRGIPSAPTLKRLFGSFANAIEAAGFDRPTRGTRYVRAGVAQPAERPLEPPAAPLEQGDAGSTPATRHRDDEPTPVVALLLRQTDALLQALRDDTHARLTALEWELAIIDEAIARKAAAA